MNYLISYDITDDRLRSKIVKHLGRAGLYRLQYSVFTGSLSNAISDKLADELRNLQQEKVWQPEDSILILPLHKYSNDRLEIIGQTPEDWDLMQGNLHTLVL
ncbi:MAG: CRISPR-associated endonuclease Cas2 [Bacteroidota bacterium]